MAVYLDHAATSPMPPEVLEVYTDALRVSGNPASVHGAGQAARELLESGRDAVAASVGADPAEIVLTGGGTEAVNLALKGLFWSRNPVAEAVGGAVRSRLRRARIVIPEAEHHATLDAVEWLVVHEGAILDRIPVDEVGRIRLDALEAALDRGGDEVALVTAIWANNEVGTIQPVREIAALAARHGVPLHLDAIAAYGQLPIDVHELGVTALSLAAHKIGGPVGSGALLLARSARVEPLLHGGGQERDVRSGTLDVPGTAAFAAAAEAAAARRAEHVRAVAALRDRLVAGVLAAVPDAVLNGDPAAEGRLAANAHFSFPGCEGDALLMLLDAQGIECSTGSACSAGVPQPSHVLLAMGRDARSARSSLRFSLGHTSVDSDVDALLAALPAAVERARAAGYASARR
jgi:cysteine desulfurase